MAVRRRSSSTWTGSTRLIERRGGHARAEAPGLDRLPRGRRALRGRRRRLELAGLAPARDLHRPRQGQPHLGHRRQRVHRLPPRLRRDGGRATRTRRSSRRSSGRPRCGTHFAQPTKHLDVIGENLADRFGLPLWRFCNSGTEATLEAARLMRANTGRDMHHQDRGHLPRPPRLADVLGGARPGPDGAARAPGHGAAGAGHPAGVRRPRARRAVQRPRGGRAGVRRERGRGRRHDRRAGDDELRRDPAGARLPAGAEGSRATRTAPTSRSTR